MLYADLFGGAGKRDRTIDDSVAISISRMLYADLFGGVRKRDRITDDRVAIRLLRSVPIRDAGRWAGRGRRGGGGSSGTGAVIIHPGLTVLAPHDRVHPVEQTVLNMFY